MQKEKKIKEPKIKPNSGIGIIILLLGTAIFLYGSWGVFSGLSAKRWPKTDGVITHSKVTTTRGSSKSSTSHANIKYQYKVNKTVYIGNRVRFVLLEGGNIAYKVIAKYPLGKTVKVYYNKSRPADSVLEPGTSIGGVVMLGFGLLLSSIGIFMLVYHYLYVKPWMQSIYNIPKKSRTKKLT